MSGGIADVLAAAATDALFGKTRKTVEIDIHRYQQWCQQYGEMERHIDNLQSALRYSEQVVAQQTQQIIQKDKAFTEERMLRLSMEVCHKSLQNDLDKMGFAPDIEVRLSEEHVAVNFIKTQIRAFLRLQGFDVGNRSVQTISKNLNNQQRQICNILLIASADFKLFKNYIAEVVSAIKKLTEDLNKETLNAQENQIRTTLVLAFDKIRMTLMERMTELHRPCSTIGEEWIEQRAAAIRQSIRLEQIDGRMYRIAPDSIPQITSVNLLSIPNTSMGQVVGAIQECISENAKPVLIAQGFAAEYLFPSAYHTNAFGLNNYLMPVDL
jgi:hypothetical protein